MQKEIKQIQEKAREELERRINPENYESRKFHQLNDPKGDCLLDLEWYPESSYELNPNKVMDFIDTLIEKVHKQARQEMIKEIKVALRKIKGVDEMTWKSIERVLEEKLKE